MQPDSIIQPTQPATGVHPSAKLERKILVIEDERFIGDLYERALRAGGYTPTVVIDGETALKEAQTNQYDIILLDIMVPNLTGTEILTNLRDPSKTPNFKAKVVVTTNLELDDEGRAAIESQADGYIVKADVTPKELVAYLDQIDLGPSLAA